MNITILPSLCCLLISLTVAIGKEPSVITSETLKIGDQETPVELTVITIPKELNKGFELVDIEPDQSGRETAYVDDQFETKQHLLIFNGGYFDSEFNPVGLCKLDGQIITDKPAPKLSGYVVIDAQGGIDLLWKQRQQAKQAPTVLQSGPYIIDPGGKVGIRTQSGKSAPRTVLAIDKQGNLLVIVTNRVTLFRLARILSAKLPQIDRALNLDGGPSTGLIHQQTKIENGVPVRNFIRLNRN